MVFGFEVIGKSHTFALGLGSAHGFKLVAAFCNQLVFVNDGGILIFCWRV
jgi:hypothetical protein